MFPIGVALYYPDMMTRWTPGFFGAISIILGVFTSILFLIWLIAGWNTY